MIVEARNWGTRAVKKVPLVDAGVQGLSLQRPRRRQHRGEVASV